MVSPMNYSNMGLSMYVTVDKLDGIWDRRNLRRYVNISFAYGNDSSKVYIPSVICKQDLFNFNEDLNSIYQAYIAHLNENYTFCPMIDEYQNAVIQGNIDQKSSMTYSLEVARCDPANLDGT
jgi:hypothetical protein